MDKEYDGIDRRKNGFFSNREIWEQVFGHDGRGGAIGELHNKVDESFNGLEKMVCQEFNNLGKKLDEYNGLRESLYEMNDSIESLDGKVESQADDFKKQKDDLDKEAFKDSTKEETFEKGKKEAFREIKQFIAIVAIALTALGGVIALLGIFVF